jgi:hypothetical protein
MSDEETWKKNFEFSIQKLRFSIVKEFKYADNADSRFGAFKNVDLVLLLCPWSIVSSVIEQFFNKVSELNKWSAVNLWFCSSETKNIRYQVN